VLEFNDDRMPMGRAAIDFALGSFYLRRMLWGVVAPNDSGRCQVWFRHAHPLDTRVHDILFKRAVLVFGASRHAIVFPADRLDLPMRRSDPALHDLLVRSIDDQMMKLSTEMTMTQQVRAILREDIAIHGSAEFVSEHMKMSQRTLCRRLTSEGTSFQRLLDEVRCGLALRHLIGERMSVSDTARRLGYSEANSFHRAFRRWFGTSPSEYLAAVRRR
jgi:AraC-like DNA-binding protein